MAPGVGGREHGALDLAGAGLAAEAEALWRRHCAAGDDLAGLAAAGGTARLDLLG